MNFIIYELYLNKVDKNLVGVEAWGAHLEKALHPLPPSRGGTLLPQGVVLPLLFAGKLTLHYVLSQILVIYLYLKQSHCRFLSVLIYWFFS